MKVDKIEIVKDGRCYLVKGLDFDKEKSIVFQQHFLNPNHLADYIKHRTPFLRAIELEKIEKELTRLKEVEAD